MANSMAPSWHEGLDEWANVRDVIEGIPSLPPLPALTDFAPEMREKWQAQGAEDQRMESFERWWVPKLAFHLLIPPLFIIGAKLESGKEFKELPLLLWFAAAFFGGYTLLQVFSIWKRWKKNWEERG
jgi:hypothetical protein